MNELDITEPAAIYGEAVAGEAAALRSRLEALIEHRNASFFDIGDLLHQVRKGLHYQAWGFSTFKEYRETLDMSGQVAGYAEKIANVMEAVGIPRTVYEPLGRARLRLITSLKPQEIWTNPHTGEKIPMRTFIAGFIERGKELPFEDLKQHIRTLKGFVGENDLVWLNLCLKRSVLNSAVRPALDQAKRILGSSGKDDEGISIDTSDGAALECISIEFLNDPANQFLAEAA
jgi:hypothetical protein